MIELWNLLLSHPLLNLLIGFTRLTGDLGWSIILMTVGLRLAMTPLVIPSLKVSKKMQELAPLLSKLKQEHKGDKTALLTAQAELYKKHGVNPGAGCLPQIIQLLVLIALFNAFSTILKPNGNELISKLNPVLYSFNQLSGDFRLTTSFLGKELSKPDVFSLPGVPFPLPGIFLLLSAATQFLSSKMMMPEAKAQEKLAQKTPEDTDDMMAASQKQMLYMFPLMTVLFGYQFPFGLVLYWTVFSAVSMVQQYFATGWGDLAPWLRRLGMLKSA